MQQLANAYIDRITRQQITPLILSNVDDSNPPTQLDEPHPWQWLGQDISQLSFSAHMIYNHFTIADTLSNIMIPCINVFASLMIDWILAQLNC